MISRFIYLVTAILLSTIIIGCGSVAKSIVGKQVWSENYAAVEGVEATSPMMVDGDMATVGETQTSTGRGSMEVSEAVIKLPEEKSIRRIVLHTPNIQTFSIYAGVDDEDTWKSLQEVKNNDAKKIDMSVSTTTDRIKIRVRETSDDELLPGGRGRNRRRVRHAKGKIQEIEIYGLVEVDSAEAGDSGTEPGEPSLTAKEAEEEKPKAPPVVASIESPQNTYALSDAIPVNIALEIGSDEVVTVEDYVSDEMLKTKLIVKTESGDKVSCSKAAPKLSSPHPYRGSGKEVMVRDARTLDADSTVTVTIADLKEYYPISEPGKYTVQFSMDFRSYNKFVGSVQTQIEDMERTIRDINSRSNYTQTERASLIQSLKEEIDQLKQKKARRYIVSGTSGESLGLSSNVLEITIQ
jgi:hypothetical protein